MKRQPVLAITHTAIARSQAAVSCLKLSRRDDSRLENLPSTTQRFIQTDEPRTNLRLATGHAIIDFAKTALRIQDDEKVSQAETVELSR